MNIKNLLIKGSFYRTINVLVNMGVAIYIMPFLIHGIGERSYGMWLMVMSILGHFGLMELGVGRANQHSIINALEKGDPDLLNKSVSTALAIYTGLAFVALILVMGVVVSAPIFFENPEEAHIFQLIVSIQGMQAVLEFPVMATIGILVAKLRYDVIAYLQIGKIIIRTILIVAIVGQTKSILHLSLITLFSELLAYVLSFSMAWRYCPSLKISTKFVSVIEFKKLMGFGKWVFLITLANKFKVAIPNYIIAGALSLGFVSHYAIADRLFSYVGSIIGSMLNVFFPVFAKFYANADYKKVKEQFSFSIQITSIAATMAYGMLFILGQKIIYIWMGENFLGSFAPLAVLCIFGIFSAPLEQCLSLLYAMDKHRLYSIVNIGDMLLTLVLCYLLVVPFGMAGVALGFGVPILLKYLITGVVVNNLLSLSLIEWVRNTGLFIGHTFSILALCAWVLYNNNYEWEYVIATALLFSIVYPISAFYLQMSNSSRHQVISILPEKFPFRIIKSYLS